MRSERMMKMAEKHRAMTIRQAAEKAGVKEYVIRHAIKTKKLEAIEDRGGAQIGPGAKAWPTFVRESALNKWLKARKKTKDGE